MPPARESSVRVPVMGANGVPASRALPTCANALVIAHILIYIGTMVRRKAVEPDLDITRTQTGIRMERRLLKVLKGLAEFKDMTLGDLLEGIVLHAFEGKHAFSPDTLKKIAELKKIYELDLHAGASHRMKERS